MLIRPAGPDDLPAVAAIYNREVDEGVATFDTEHRSGSHWHTLLTDGEPLFVAADETGVHGYASAFSYRTKLGYRFTREASIYVAPLAQGKGLGRQLYGEHDRWIDVTWLQRTV